MGNLSNYESNEIGKARMATLRGYGAQCTRIVNDMYKVAVEYHGFRESLDPVVDAEDIAYADASLSYMVTNLKPTIDGLTVDQKAWLDSVMNDLGYAPIVE